MQRCVFIYLFATMSVCWADQLMEKLQQRVAQDEVAETERKDCVESCSYACNDGTCCNGARHCALCDMKGCEGWSGRQQVIAFNNLAKLFEGKPLGGCCTVGGKISFQACGKQECVEAMGNDQGCEDCGCKRGMQAKFNAGWDRSDDFCAPPVHKVFTKYNAAHKAMKILTKQNAAKKLGMTAAMEEADELIRRQSAPNMQSSNQMLVASGQKVEEARQSTGMYVMGDLDELCEFELDDDVYVEELDDAHECLKASDELGLPFSTITETDETEHPSGCFVTESQGDAQQLFFNENEDGNSNSFSRPICKQETEF